MRTTLSIPDPLLHRLRLKSAETGRSMSWWGIFTERCAEAGASGRLVPDAALAALAIEHDATLVTCDADFGRWRGLRTAHPLQA
jgi:predicted nucleic acid-binding protein